MEIQEEIKDLTEKFSNLFEVDGLGEPASDVPPSTNKLKKDRKTKDGKVELVSVEDELFPKDGNDREQFRQKVIDTINGMIQGTSTLEDLLQVVRSKQLKHVKEGYEGAIEILEEIINEVSKERHIEAAKNSIPLRQEEFSYADKVASKTIENINKKHDEEAPLTHAELDLGQKLSDFAEKRKKRLEHAKEVVGVKEGFEGTIEILEEIINEKYVFPKKAVEDGNKKYLEADKKKNEATRLARKGFEKLNKKIKELKAKGIDTDLDIQPGVTYVGGSKGEYQKALKTAQGLHDKQREADREFTKADNEQRKLRLEGNKGVIKREFEPVSTKKGDSYNFKKVLNKNESLKEAMEVLEQLLGESKSSEVVSELFDRPDLLNDIDNALGSPVKKTVKNIIKSITNPKKKEKKVKVKESFDSSLEKGYNNIEKTLSLLEAIINEVSDKKYREKLEELKDGIKRAEEFKEATKDEVVKKKINNIIIPQEHRLNVSHDKYEDRIVDREREKYEKGKAERKKRK